MLIEYRGERKKEGLGRVAWIMYDDESEKETELARRLTSLIDKVCPEYTYDDSVAGNIFVDVENKKDYEFFKKWYKESKKMFLACMRYGF